MRRVVITLSHLVERFPIPVIVTAIVVSIGLGVYGAEFNAQDSGGNEAFAPDTPELLAAERIGDIFGDESGTVPMQLLITAEGGDVLTVDALAAIQTATQYVVAESAIAGDVAPGTEQQPSVVTHLFPALAATQGTPPATDADLKAAFEAGVAALPPEQGQFVSFLYPSGTDPLAGPVDKAMSLVFLQAPTNDTFDALIERLDEMVTGLDELALPAGYEVAPFSQEIVFTTQDEFLQEVGRLFGQAFLIIIVILFTVFWFGRRLSAFRRTAADVGLTMFTIVLALMWVWGFWKLLYDAPNPMTQIIPILLIGLGVDYSIHLTTRYREEIANGNQVDGAINLAIRTVGISLVLATITTAVGFLTNITNDIKALQGFGVLSAVGIIASFLLMLTFVPAVRFLLDRRAEAAGRMPPSEAFAGGEGRLLPRLAGRAAVVAQRVPAFALIAALVLGVVGAYGVTRLETSFSFLDFVPTNSPVRDTAEVLLDEFAIVGETTNVLVEGDVTTGAAWNAMVAGSQAATGVENVTTLQTPNGVVALGDTPVVLVAQLAEQVPEVGQAAAAVGLSRDLTVTGNDVTPLYDALFAAVPGQAAAVLADDYSAALLAFQTGAGEQGAGAIQQDLTDAFSGMETTGVEYIVTSNNIINDVIINSLRDSQVSSLAITLAVAALLLVVSFGFETRRPMLGIITALPVILVVIWSLGIMAAIGIPFGPVTATISALAIGIGIPYTIHITRRYLEDQARFATPEEAIQSTTTNTGGALAGSAITTIAGFGILTTSTTVPFQQFGLVTAYTIGLSLLGAILILPSMLVLWDRYHRNRGDRPDAVGDEFKELAAAP